LLSLTLLPPTPKNTTTTYIVTSIHTQKREGQLNRHLCERLRVIVVVVIALVAAVVVVVVVAVAVASAVLILIIICIVIIVVMRNSYLSLLLYQGYKRVANFNDRTFACLSPLRAAPR
jgi:uncharacterized membrane protein YphA (DoxX/SURF4 family)